LIAALKTRQAPTSAANPASVTSASSTTFNLFGIGQENVTYAKGMTPKGKMQCRMEDGNSFKSEISKA
jgi:hypothetical protein